LREHDLGGRPRGRRRPRFDDDEPYSALDDTRYAPFDDDEPDSPFHDEPVDDEPDSPFHDEPQFLKRRRRDARALSLDDDPDTNWTTWDASGVLHGPEPRPDWVVTALAAVDADLGILKTGKEADVHLVRREVPDGGPSSLLAAKRYRAPEHRLFHRDAGYVEGRRVRRSRETRAMANRTAAGRQMLAGQWATAEFAALSRLYELDVAVPYPVQLLGTELMLEFVGDPDGAAASRLAQLRPDRAELADLWRQLVDALVTMARAGLAHGDLSPYNILVHDGRLVLIDLPQVVDVVTNPQGRDFLVRDVRNVAKWFGARGLDVDPDDMAGDLLADAGVR
jgi:RIO kinase 1